MKCPVCGNEEFVEVDSFLMGAVEVEGRDTNKYYGCTKCNLILQFNEELVKKALEKKN